MVLRVDSEVILGPILGPYLRNLKKPHRTVNIPLHLAVGRAFSLKYTNIWVLEGAGWVPV